MSVKAFERDSGGDGKREDTGSRIPSSLTLVTSVCDMIPSRPRGSVKRPGLNIFNMKTNNLESCIVYLPASERRQPSYPPLPAPTPTPDPCLLTMPPI
jgi:hypothetical protein